MSKESVPTPIGDQIETAEKPLLPDIKKGELLILSDESSVGSTERQHLMERLRVSAKRQLNMKFANDVNFRQSILNRLVIRKRGIKPGEIKTIPEDFLNVLTEELILKMVIESKKSVVVD